jgi:hypothetical protein
MEDREIPVSLTEWNKVGEPAEEVGVTVQDLINDLLEAAGVSDYAIRRVHMALKANGPNLAEDTQSLQRRVHIYFNSENMDPGSVMQSEEDGNIYILEP